MKKRLGYNIRMVVGSVVGALIVLIGAGYVSTVFNPELKYKRPWSWLAASSRDELYVCKQDVDPSYQCIKRNSGDLSKDLDRDGSNDNVVKKGDALEYRIDFNMPMP